MKPTVAEAKARLRVVAMRRVSLRDSVYKHSARSLAAVRRTSPLALLALLALSSSRKVLLRNLWGLFRQSYDA
jgi:hypothetical protein